MKSCILIVDDDHVARTLSTEHLTGAGYEVEQATNGEQAIAMFAPGLHDLVITDLRMPGVSGLDVLSHVKAVAPEVPVLVVTAHGSVELAVEAIRTGASDFLEKPLMREELVVAAGRALERHPPAGGITATYRDAAGIEQEIIAESEDMQALLRTVDRAARSDAPVLIVGESGTGKELVARRLHTRSTRADNPFVAVDCMMPADTLELQLFGLERGAFTATLRARGGRTGIEGTVFLDEIAEIPLPLQGKLLRVLREGQVDVKGLGRPVPVDVRVVAATQRDLVQKAAEGSFSADLYYRLNVVELKVPPLRERPDDIVALARHFIARLAPGRDLVIADELLADLCQYHWPGNVRELRNACERLIILCEGETLRRSDLPRTRSAIAGGGR